MFDFIKEMAYKNIGSLSLFLNNKKNHDYLDYLNNNIPSGVLNFKISEKVYYLINNINHVLLCSCGDPLSFIGFKNGHRNTCGKKECVNKKRRETCIEKWGVDNPKKSKSILEKEKENIKIRWNGGHYMKNDLVREKFKNTMIERWGVEWSQQSNEIRKKSLESWVKNPNREEIVKRRKISLLNKSDDEKNEINRKRIEKIKEKWTSYEDFVKWRLDRIKESSIEKWGLEHHLKSDFIKNKRIESYKNGILEKIKSNLPDHIIFISKSENENKTDSIINLLCKKCNNEFKINRQLFVSRSFSNIEICLNCNPILSGKSKKELDLYEFIKNNYDGVILTNDRGVISKELDIYLPDIGLAFDFNGLYWHSDLYRDKFYHINKTKECLNKDVKLIHIWEDDWDNKQDIIKSIIINKLNKTSKRIFARNCYIKEIDNVTCRDFLERNHIQGFVGSKVKIGLFYNDEMVSIMTFGNLRRSLGKKSKQGNWELLRFCNKIGINVIGGASKLLKYFINNWCPNTILSYSDTSRYDGHIYRKLSFDYLGETEPNYYWIIDGLRKHRFNFRKDILIKEGYDPNKTEVEIMRERGIYRIFDCGSKKWIWRKE